MSLVLYIIVPCYKDEKTLFSSVPVFIDKMETLMKAHMISPASRLVLINDGSPDQTWATILTLREKNKNRVTAINLARNFGEQNALIAGMNYAAEKADCVITMDSDLQDDINAVDEMLTLYAEGKDVVFGVRSNRHSDGLFEKLCSGLFYFIMKVAKTGLVDEHSNYRLLSKRAIIQLIGNLPDSYFLPCAVSNLNLPSEKVFYERRKRISGTSSYSFRRKLNLAKDAVFSHSNFPLKLISFSTIISLLIANVFLFVFLFFDRTKPFIYFLPLSLLFFAGTMVFLFLRIIGEYVYKAFCEAKRSRKYQIDSILEDE